MWIPVSPQGHVFKRLTQGPRGQRTHHAENPSSLAALCALWVMCQGHPVQKDPGSELMAQQGNNWEERGQERRGPE